MLHILAIIQVLLYICLIQQSNIIKNGLYKQSHNMTTNTATSQNGLISALVSNCVEFFFHKNEVYCLHNGVRYNYEKIPAWIIEIIEKDMVSNPEAIKALATWENLTIENYIRQYITCRFGGNDDLVDIEEDGTINYTEFFECGLRGQCNYEGKLCTSIRVANGHISKTEISVLKLINLPDKLIADKLNISQETVVTHQQNIRNKTGCRSKVELAIFAQKKGIYNDNII